MLHRFTGRVYEARDPNGKLVAVKKSHVTSSVKQPMLRHEACALSLAEHKSIPRVYAWGRSQWFEYLVTERLGRTLVEFMEKQQQFRLRGVLLLWDEMVRRLLYSDTLLIVRA